MGLLKKVIAKMASMGFKGGTHEHHAGEFSTGARPTGRVASRAPGSATKRKTATSTEARSAGHALRSAQSLAKSQRALRRAKSAKTDAEREHHSREAARHAERSLHHSSKITTVQHAAVGEKLRRHAEQTHAVARKTTKSVSALSPAVHSVRRTSVSAPIGPFGASVLFKRKGK